MSGYDGSTYAVGIVSALWLGILTSISPCPLATNVAAISYIGRRVASPRRVFLTGALYAIGRTFVYLALGSLLVASVLSVPQLSLFLQKYMNKLLGPILIVVAMFLLGLIQLNISGPGLSDQMQKRVDALGMWGALVLGMLFALTFCPVSAALFFGSLIPLSVKVGSGVILPSLYGVGTALPVLVFATLVAVSARSVGQAFNAVSKIELWARRITGALFLLVGLYYALKFVFGVI